MNHLECRCGAQFQHIRALLEHREVHSPREMRIIQECLHDDVVLREAVHFVCPDCGECSGMELVPIEQVGRVS